LRQHDNNQPVLICAFSLAIISMHELVLAGMGLIEFLEEGARISQETFRARLAAETQQPVRPDFLKRIVQWPTGNQARAQRIRTFSRSSDRSVKFFEGWIRIFEETRIATLAAKANEAIAVNKRIRFSHCTELHSGDRACLRHIDLCLVLNDGRICRFDEASRLLVERFDASRAAEPQLSSFMGVNNGTAHGTEFSS
jgi:hypothetical protein